MRINLCSLNVELKTCTNWGKMQIEQKVLFVEKSRSSGAIQHSVLLMNYIIRSSMRLKLASFALIEPQLLEFNIVSGIVGI